MIDEDHRLDGVDRDDPRHRRLAHRATVRTLAKRMRYDRQAYDKPIEES